MWQAGLCLLHMLVVAGLPRAAKENRFQHTGSFQVSSSITFANAHWPKRVTWPSPDSRNGEIDHLEKASAKSDCMCWLQMHTQMVRTCGHSKSCPSICTILPSYQLMRGPTLISTNTCSPFHISLSAEWLVAFYCALIFIFLITNVIKHLFMYWLRIWKHPVLKRPFKPLVHFSIGISTLSTIYRIYMYIH